MFLVKTVLSFCLMLRLSGFVQVSSISIITPAIGCDIISWLDGWVKKDPWFTKCLYWNQNRTPLHNCSNQYLQNTANYRVEYTEPKRLEEMKEKRNKAMDVYCYILLVNNPRRFMSFVYPFLKFAGPLLPLQRMNWLFLAFQQLLD